ncbi:zinc ribbon domain-containing protein [Alcaligenaceae bacterium]|nr:zinc ribbon domain-containing protein [Alcaligenaceae bacterium]
MEIFAFWALLALLVGVLASSFGRNGFGWFLIALVLSPLIGGVALLIAGKKDGGASQRASGPTMKCPECREEILQEARVCKHCGHRLLTPEEALARESAASIRVRNRRLLALAIVGAMAYIIYNSNT